MTPTQLKQQIRERLRELAEKRGQIEAEEKALGEALGAMGGAVPGRPGKRRTYRGRVRKSDRRVQILGILTSNPERSFEPNNMPDFDVPRTTAQGIFEELVSEGKVVLVHRSPSGMPVVRARTTGDVEDQPEPEPTVAAGATRGIPEPQVAEEKRQRTRRRPIRPMRETRSRIVKFLSEHGPSSQEDVREALDLASSTMTTAVQGMEATVERERVRNTGGRHGWTYMLRLKGRGEGEREAVTRPGEGTEEGRLRDGPANS